MLKIYSQNRGVYGMTIVVANSKKEAIKFMELNSEEWEYSSKQLEELDEHEIENGFFLENRGDR